MSIKWIEKNRGEMTYAFDLVIRRHKDHSYGGQHFKYMFYVSDVFLKKISDKMPDRIQIGVDGDRIYFRPSKTGYKVNVSSKRSHSFIVPEKTIQNHNFTSCVQPGEYDTFFDPNLNLYYAKKIEEEC